MRESLKTLILIAGPLLMLSINCMAQTQSPEIKIVKTYPNDGGYVLEINGKLLTTIDEGQAKQIEHDRNALDAANKTISIQADEIASLKKTVDLQERLDAINNGIIRIQNDQIGRFTAMVGKLDALISKSDSIAAGQPKGKFLDKFSVRLFEAGISTGASARTLFTPCH